MGQRKGDVMGNRGFDGPDLTKPDTDRLARQLDQVRNAMTDQEWKTLGEIQRITGFPQASISARLRDLRKARFGAFIVERRRAGPIGTFEYRVLPYESPQIALGVEP